MLLAVTGTPGTGKTSVCKLLSLLGYEVLDLKTIILEKNLCSGYSEESDSLEIDIDVIRDHFHQNPPGNNERWTIIESHLSHYIEVDGIVLLRCDPRELEKRLGQRDYSAEKIRENVESEMVDVIAMEVIERNLPSIEIDTTGFEKEEVADLIIKFIEGFPDISGYSSPCSANWIGEMYDK